MVDKKEQNKQVDADILKCKEDVRRARNEAVKESPQEKQPDKVQVEVKPIRAVKVEKKPAQKKQTEEKSGEIPTFNLADQILAKQRNISSTRRQKTRKTNPVEKSYPANDTVGEIIKQSKPVTKNLKPEPQIPAALKTKVRSINLSNEDLNKLQRQLVADIVSRDIALLCG